MTINEALAFDDVLLVPTYTEVRSRSIPKLDTDIAGVQLTLPMISSPMDTVTESRMAIAVGLAGGMGVIHRFMSVSEQIDNIRSILRAEESEGREIPKVAAVGLGRDEVARFKELWSSVPLDAVLVDVANGHSSYMKDGLSKIKDIAPGIRIIAGNVATGEGFYYLGTTGMVDAVRVGIGSGCFIPGSMVMTKDGYKPIESISIGDFVLTHTGSWKEVINTMIFEKDEEILTINNISCTKNHEFYVVNKLDANIITEDNISSYAFWIEAEHLSEEEHLLIELD